MIKHWYLSGYDTSRDLLRLLPPNAQTHTGCQLHENNR
jgi:hypothetical protein